MAQVDLIMPKMGESIMEATILQWVKQVGDSVAMDETVLEISTDKVDSEVPSPVEGVLKQILFQENDVVPIGAPIAILEVEGPESLPSTESVGQAASEIPKPAPEKSFGISPSIPPAQVPLTVSNKSDASAFYSPLVKNMAKEEGIPLSALDAITGSGKDGRVTKADMLAFIQSSQQKSQPEAQPITTVPPKEKVASPVVHEHGPNVEIVEMSRMRKMIAKHMVDSKHTAPHVTSFVEVDVTPIVEWRNAIKDNFMRKHGEKITFTPIFLDAVVKGIQQFPMINSSISGENILIKKDINLGMATAMEDGNLIVPVIKNADYLNLIGLTKTVNDLALRARKNNLKPDEIQGGTFTMTNVGTFGSMMGTPIINQPQVAILAVGAIKKKPVVLETEKGDVIAIRHMMIMSLSYDHRIVDGALGSMFLKTVGEVLEGFVPIEF